MNAQTTTRPMTVTRLRILIALDNLKAEVAHYNSLRMRIEDMQTWETRPLGAIECNRMLMAESQKKITKLQVRLSRLAGGKLLITH